MSDLPPEGPRKQGPILFDLDEQKPPLSPSEAPPVPEPDLPGPQGQAMTTAAALAARQPSKLARWFWALAGTLVSALISIAAWRFAMDLIASVPLLGLAVSVLMGLVVLVGLAIVVKELAAMSRLAKVDALHRAADAALASDDLKAARKVVDQLSSLYAGREDTRWGREAMAELVG